MIKVSEMNNEKLCEAISELREQNAHPVEIYVSDERNWVRDVLNDMTPVNYWLLPENWTRLLEELSEFGYIKLMFSKNIGTWNVTWGIWIPVVSASTKERAVCEAYAIAFGGGKYE